MSKSVLLYLSTVIASLLTVNIPVLADGITRQSSNFTGAIQESQSFISDIALDPRNDYHINIKDGSYYSENEKTFSVSKLLNDLELNDTLKLDYTCDMYQDCPPEYIHVKGVLGKGYQIEFIPIVQKADSWLEQDESDFPTFGNTSESETSSNDVKKFDASYEDECLSDDVMFMADDDYQAKVIKEALKYFECDDNTPEEIKLEAVDIYRRYKTKEVVCNNLKDKVCPQRIEIEKNSMISIIDDFRMRKKLAEMCDRDYSVSSFIEQDGSDMCRELECACIKKYNNYTSKINNDKNYKLNFIKQALTYFGLGSTIIDNEKVEDYIKVTVLKEVAKGLDYNRRSYIQRELNIIGSKYDKMIGLSKTYCGVNIVF